MTVNNRIPNRLFKEKSPYLLQHAHNPVHWFPWCEEAFEKAKGEDKPIFLSIGYSTCHWCHVMERESFEDEEVANILNENFISIKVDREERPDIDSIYMTFCQSITGEGGWPLTILMTPDKKPFYAGTYFPKRAKYGRAGLIDVLEEIKEKWSSKREGFEIYSDEITKALKNSMAIEAKEDLEEDVLENAFHLFKDNYDPLYGGFGRAPKFPTPHNLYFLFRYYKSTQNEEALHMALKTLDAMYQGGIFDHIGFGFSRYATDEKWLVPHFEKMLYDNALLAMAYIEGYQITRKKLYKEITEKIFTYVMRDMTSLEGGFYCAEDADSEGVEGKFYLWREEEIKNVLGEEEGKIFCRYYNITKEGNFEGKNIPNLVKENLWELEENEKIKIQLEKSRKKLFEYREERIHPHKDDKILTSWNGLMIAALSRGGSVFQEEKHIQCAQKALDFILKKLVREDKRLLARYREKEAAYLGYIEDYAFLVWGLIELYEATFEEKHLKKAEEFVKDMFSIFWDEEEGGFFLYGKDGEELALKPKEVYDGAVPSGNSVAALNILKLSQYVRDEQIKEKVNILFKIFGKQVKDYPIGYTYFLTAFLLKEKGLEEILIAGIKEEKDTKEMLKKINTLFLPYTLLKLEEEKEKMIENQATAYVCKNFHCNEPVNDLEKVVALLENNK